VWLRDFVALPTDGTSLLPAAPRKAVADGSFSRVSIVIGSNRDEGRTFQQDSIGWREADYAKWVSERFGDKADKIIAEYPWPKDANEYTGAYLAGAVITDNGQDAGIGGCANLTLTQDVAKYAPVYAYEFGHRTGPGLTREHGVYEWGAGHAAELAYLFPSFNNGEPITPLFNAGERVLAERMKAYWARSSGREFPATRLTRPGPSSTLLASTGRSRRTIGLSSFQPSSSNASTTANSGTRTSGKAKGTTLCVRLRPLSWPPCRQAGRRAYRGAGGIGSDPHAGLRSCASRRQSAMQSRKAAP
jgi:hypothetical protein